MTHRGAVGADARDGDGAGVMTAIPHAFLKREYEIDQNFKLPPPGQYAVGNIFFNTDPQIRAESQTAFEAIAKQLGLRVLGWREVPRDSTILGPTARSKEPSILQPIVVLEALYGNGNSPEKTDGFDEKYFERQLYVLRKQSTHRIGLQKWFYICSLSNKNIIYKGQLAPVQVYNYFYDLNNVNYTTHFALVHSRFSTNTFPSWDRAQPMRWAAHNGN
jgi:glutamate synthase (NADH)